MPLAAGGQQYPFAGEGRSLILMTPNEEYTLFRKIHQKFRNRRTLSRLYKEVDQLKEDLDFLRSRLDLDDTIYEKFNSDRYSTDYMKAFEGKDPLVSVCVATFNRADLLTSRSLPSILNQDYNNLEVIVVGDCCTDNTQELIEQIDDPRIKFINLKTRGIYPQDPKLRWMVAGTTPMNIALDMAQGSFITHLDDDDEYHLDRIRKLVRFSQDKRLDFVWHPFSWEKPSGKWRVQESLEFKKTHVTTSSSFYHNWFKSIHWDLEAYQYREPGDWNRFRKFKYLGVKAERFPESLLKHYREKAQ